MKQNDESFRHAFGASRSGPPCRDAAVAAFWHVLTFNVVPWLSNIGEVHKDGQKMTEATQQTSMQRIANGSFLHIALIWLSTFLLKTRSKHWMSPLLMMLDGVSYCFMVLAVACWHLMVFDWWWFKFDLRAWWRLLVPAGTRQSLLVLDAAWWILMVFTVTTTNVSSWFSSDPLPSLITVFIQGESCCLLSWAVGKQRNLAFYQLQSQPCGSGTSDTCTESRIQLSWLIAFIKNTKDWNLYIISRDVNSLTSHYPDVVWVLSVFIVDDHEPFILVIWQIQKNLGNVEMKTKITSVTSSYFACHVLATIPNSSYPHP